LHVITCFCALLVWSTTRDSFIAYWTSWLSSA